MELDRPSIIRVCRAIGQCDLTASRVLILNASQAGPTMSALAEEVGISNGATTGLVETMERDGLVERQRGSGVDLRKVTVTLTDDGRHMLEAFFDRFKPTHA